MTTDKQAILTGIKNAVKELLPDSEILLFGSRARNEQRADSDWDILVLTTEKVDEKLKKKVRDRLFYEGLENEICISSLIFNKDDWQVKFSRYPLFFEIQKEGILV
jgi:uncharacterized protein